ISPKRPDCPGCAATQNQQNNNHDDNDCGTAIPGGQIEYNTSSVFVKPIHPSSIQTKAGDDEATQILIGRRAVQIGP
ncbi:MAG: hypothetical protein JXA33_11275, partial [Anaerolineae bacterium]|nr:hypothetical protein [Anaerolineae bacterium]